MDAPLLVTLGDLRLDRAGAPVLAHRRKELVLLAYLARRGGPVSRDELAELLWGASDEPRGRQSLRQALASIRRTLPGALDTTGDDAVRLCPGAVWLDAALLEADVRAGRHAEAVARWGGDFLPRADDVGHDGFRLWLERERAALRRRLYVALERLVADAEAAGSAEAAARWAGRWAEVAPHDEAVHLRLMRALSRAGRGGDALRVHADLVARLRDDLGVAPSAELRRAADEAAEAERRRSRPRPGSAALLTPDLVGRDAALAALEEPWDGAATRGRVVLLEGEPGMGKSRLCAEFARRLRRGHPSATVLEARADERDAAAPFTTLRRLLAELAGATALADVPSRAVADLATVAPALLARFPAAARADGGAPDLAAALLAALRALARQGPVLVVLDDAAAADDGTRAVLRAVLRASPPAAVVLTGRDAEPGWPSLRDELALLPEARRLRLQPLSEAHVDALLASMLEMATADRRALAARLAAEGDGNPYHVTETVYALADAGLLVLGADGVWHTAAALSALSLPMPAGMRGALAERLARLSPAGRRVLEACADHRGPADAGRLAAATGLPPDVLSAALGELVTRRLLRPADPPGSFECAHELLRRTVRELAAAPAGAALAPAPADGTRPQRPRHGRRWRSALGVALLGVGVALVALLRAGADAEPVVAATSAVPQRVVVTPLRNETDDPDLDRLGRIAADWLRTGIGRTGLVTVVPGVLVPPDTVVEPAGGRRGLLGRTAAAAEGARAELAIGGSVYRSGDSLWLQVVVVNVAARSLVTTVGPVAADPGSPMDGVERLRQAVLAALAPHLDARLAAQATVQSTPPSYEAYREFAAALELVAARRGSAVPHLLRAYALDSSYTLPLLYAITELDATGQLARADSLVGTLLRRRDELAPFDRHQLDFFAARFAGDRLEQLAAARRAYAVAPGSLNATLLLARSAVAVNRPREALRALDAVDPSRPQDMGLSGYWSMLAGTLHLLGEYDRQLEVGRTVRRLMPQDVRYLFYEGRALAALGRHAELDRVLEESLLRPASVGWAPPGLDLHVVIFDELRAHGDAVRARQVLERALRHYAAAPRAVRESPAFRYELAGALYRLGRLDEARRLGEEQLAIADSAWLFTNRTDLRFRVGRVAARQGDERRVAEIAALLRAEREPYDFGQATEQLAQLQAALGRRDEAMRLLRQATAEGRPFDWNKHTTVDLAPLHGWPPFEAWLRPKG